MNPTRLAIVGLGKIARDQHLPALRADHRFAVAGIASPGELLPGVTCRASLAELLAEVPDLEAVALCTPPQARSDVARYALERGLHVLLEKPPCVTVSEAQALIDLARARGVALLAAWHSRYAPAVAPARAWIAQHALQSVSVHWKEDVRVWHPGQRWIWRAGGLGVFDPGINALSILTRLLPGRLVLKGAQLHFPRNCETPIAANLSLTSGAAVAVTVALDFLYSGEPQWDIELSSEAEQCCISRGGERLTIDGQAVDLPKSAEYPEIYRHFAQLIQQRAVDADLAPLQLVADAMLCGGRHDAPPFVE